MAYAPHRPLYFDVLSRLGGPVGLVRFCKTFLSEPGAPRLYAMSAIPARTSVYMGENFPGDAGSVGFTRDEAALGAIGECVERYSASVFDEARSRFASYDELGDEAVAFDKFEVYADEQYSRPGFPLARFRRDVPIRWVEGKSLTTGRRRWVPAAFVYIPYRPKNPDDFICYSVSSGQACHSDYTRALLVGLYEVVERDAFMISWLRRLPLPKVDILADPELSDLFRRYFADDRLTYHILDMTLDVKIPSYVCMIEGTSERGSVVAMGASTRTSRREAITKAMKEAVQDMYWCRELLRRRADWRPEPDWSNVCEFEDHVRLFCEPQMRQHVGFWLDRAPSLKLGPPEPMESASDQEKLDAAVAELAVKGFEAIVVDLTPPDVRSAELFTPKVIIPGMAVLTALHSLPALGSSRFQTVPRAMSLEGRIPTDFNPIPHPFP